MSSLELQATLGQGKRGWHQINWAACQRRVRSLQRRIVQAVKSGAWRKVKRLSYLLVHSFAARALAVKRVTENKGKKTPGMDGELWETPEKKAKAIERIGHWRGYQPVPLRRLYIPKKNGKQRPLSIPAQIDRGKQALWLQALEPIAETLADPNSYGFRPKRRCADAIDQCFKALRQKATATWILEGDIQGFFDNIRFAWLETHIPMTKRVLSKWLTSGFVERGTLYPTTTGVPQGAIISPVMSNMVLDGLEQVVRSHPRFQRRYNINYVRWADDFIVTANSRQVLAEVVLPRINAFLAERGVWLSAEKTLITPVAKGFDFLGQTLRKHDRRNGQLAKLQIKPSAASFQAIKTQIRTLCKQAAGAPPAALIERLNPLLRGWANYHRYTLCSQVFFQLDSFVWRRLFRWAKRRHPDKTGRWITDRYFPHKPGESWRFTDPATGNQVLRVGKSIKPERYLKVKGEANPFAPDWEDYFRVRDQRMALRASSPFRAKLLTQQHGRCLGCWQMIQVEEEVDLHHRDGTHQNNHLTNLALLHSTCHHQVHYAPESSPPSSRLSQDVGHA
jgi:RNA-directed DNA polymerase